MANQVAARLSGDDYQHLYAWQFVLDLKIPRQAVSAVTIEDALAGSVDDVTVEHPADANTPDTFHQVKFHVDHRSAYSTDVLLDRGYAQASLLEKFWATWRRLRERSQNRSVELHLVSNWNWETNDPFGACIDGHSGRVKDSFLDATPNSKLGKLRRRWQDALGAEDGPFAEFVTCLRFRLGYSCTVELERNVSDRMEFLNLRSDANALLIAVGIVRAWVKSGRQALTLRELEATLDEHELRRPKEAERGVAVYLTTIKEQRFEVEPDYLVDWRAYFEGELGHGGHQLKNPADWNAKLLPELQSLAGRVGNETDCRLVRARGLARLSAWFAFGHTFSSVARYTIEVDQNGRLWRTDAKSTPDLQVAASNADEDLSGEVFDGRGRTVAIGLSVSGSLEEDVRRYLGERQEEVAALLLLRPNRELGRECLRDAGDVVALADGFKVAARTFVKRWSANRLLLFYFGPLSGACFIGHGLNAVCHEIQIMEDQQPGYAPSFLLR